MTGDYLTVSTASQWTGLLLALQLSYVSTHIPGLQRGLSEPHGQSCHCLICPVLSLKACDMNLGPGWGLDMPFSPTGGSTPGLQRGAKFLEQISQSVLHVEVPGDASGSVDVEPLKCWHATVKSRFGRPPHTFLCWRRTAKAPLLNSWRMGRSYVLIKPVTSSQSCKWKPWLPPMLPSPSAPPLPLARMHSTLHTTGKARTTSGKLGVRGMLVILP